MEKDTLKFKVQKTKEGLCAWVQNNEESIKIVSVVKDVTNGDWILWYTSPMRIIWQYKTPTMDSWMDATDEEYRNGKDLQRMSWRQIEK